MCYGKTSKDTTTKLNFQFIRVVEEYLYFRSIPFLEMSLRIFLLLQPFISKDQESDLFGGNY